MTDTPWKASQREKLERLTGKQADAGGSSKKVSKKKAKKKTGTSTTE